MFAVVEFAVEQGGGLSVVNSNWLTPSIVFVDWIFLWQIKAEAY